MLFQSQMVLEIEWNESRRQQLLWHLPIFSLPYAAAPQSLPKINSLSAALAHADVQGLVIEWNSSISTCIYACLVRIEGPSTVYACNDQQNTRSAASLRTAWKHAQVCN